MEAWLAPLYEHPLVIEALQAYLQNGLDVGRTARSLHLHPNSVRYRLSRAEEIIDARLRSPETIVALHVSLPGGKLNPERLSGRYQGADTIIQGDQRQLQRTAPARR
jgi:DNA-binding PucR family transcriptional regulator